MGHRSRFWGWRKGIIVIVALCFGASTLVFSPQESRALSLGEEKELGRKLLEVIRDQVALVEDGEVLAYVQSIGSRIVDKIGITPYQYQFFIIDESVPNAFAIPGGYIFLYRGLIEMMRTEGELAGILSHEMAHIQARHIHRRIEEGRVASIAAIAGLLAGILVGMQSEATQGLVMGGIAGAQSYQLKYSRDNEAEADQLGLRYLVEAGYPARDMAGAMERLAEGRWRTNSRVPSYLSTHPALDERIGYLKDLAQKASASAPKRPPSSSSKDFSIMQAALTADYGDAQAALARFEAGARRGDVASLYGLGRLYVRQAKFKEAIPYLQDAARRDPTSPFILSTMGAAYLKQGMLPEAKKVLETALVLAPSAPIVHFRLAAVLQEMGRNEEALEHLYRIESLAPTFPEVDYRLGIILGQIKRLGAAHFHLGRYYQHQQDWKVAAFHYAKARALVQEIPQKREEIERELKFVERKKREAAYAGSRR